MTINLRPATASDSSLLVDLMDEFYRESEYSLDREWAVAAFSALLADAQRGGAWLALVDEVPVGYVVLTTRFSMEYGGLDGFVDDLFVRPAFRCQGVGSELLTTLAREGERRGLRALHVETSADSPAARLYQRLGWQNRQRLLLTKPLG